MPLQDYPSGELLPRHLSKEEIENPYQVITSFFDLSHLPEMREQLWELLVAITSSSFHKLPRREKANMLYFFTRLQQLVEAVHVIHQSSKKNDKN